MADGRSFPSDYFKSFTRNGHVWHSCQKQYFALSFMIICGMHASLANAQREVVTDPQTAQPFFDTNPERMGSNY
ncbi:hypothetical protein EUGRSUZ_D01538 [Eucalyptus grandis]|uniref:Uncharacterized protein n=2 Tax=Eucalyptus grandis TaxID=71139 RepID=A0ACC3L672_EUCGR|nr:hypothetical protein EUGRSUZ_D01538 [Eucalyptus grandis]